MKWRKHPPTVDEINPEEYWWARGHPFNRPVIVRVTAGARYVGERAETQVNFNFFADGYMSLHIWRPNLVGYRLDQLEWAGPIDPPPV